MPRYQSHLPDTPLVESDSAVLAELMARVPAHAETIKSLNEKGFAVIDPGFNAADLDAAEAFSRAQLSGSDRIQDGWISEAAIGRLAVHAPILDLLSQLYGRRAFPFQTLNFELGTQQAPHSDTYHFDSAPKRFMCGVWVALEDISPDAGPLVYYPGQSQITDSLPRRDWRGSILFRL